jgi:hypothetical protein
VSSFGAQSTAFFDELGKILDERSKSRQNVFGKDNKQRPYSNLLTQDEESGRYHPYAIEQDQPEVITRI